MKDISGSKKDNTKSKKDNTKSIFEDFSLKKQAIELLKHGYGLDYFPWTYRSDKEVVLGVVTSVWADIVKGGCDDFVCLAPQHTGVIGVENLNEYIQKEINGEVAKQRIGWIMAGVGDRVLHTKNNYAMGVYNGYLGKIVDIEHGNVCHVDYDGDIYRYEDDEAKKQLKLGYCITVHKSQGSQWKQGILICHSSHYFMWSRSLLYTALSRFREKLYIIGDRKALSRAVKNNVDERRQTYLRTVLRAVSFER